MITINEAVFAQFPILESERLRFRAFERTDAQDFFAIRTDEQVMQYMDSSSPKNMEEINHKIAEIQQDFLDKEALQWAIAEKSTSAFLGYFGCWKLDRKNLRGEIGYALLPPFWGNGYMRETLNCLINFLFQELKLHSIEANINPANENSKRLLRQFGFQQEAYFRENYFYNGQFTDSAIFCLLQSDLED